MNYNNIYLIELMKAAIFDVIPLEPSAALDWEYIFDKAVEQNIAGLICCSVKKIKKEYLPEQDLVSKFMNNMFSTVMVGAKQHNEFVCINNLMKKEGLTFIGLKGCIIRDIYPVPELRTMGDFDVLVKKEQLNEIKRIFKDNNYKIENDAYGIVCSKGTVNWEIFYTIANEFNINSRKWDEVFFTEIINNDSLCSPKPTYFLTHLLVHTAKHLLGSGAGIRNLADIALYTRTYMDDIDFDIVEKSCKEQEYFDIYVQASKVQRKKCDVFLDYMLLYGIYGKHDNTLLSQLTKRQNQDDSFVKKLFFPPKETLEHRYKYLKKYPYLLPYAWINRVFSAVFRWGFSVKRMVKDTRGAAKFSEDRDKWLDELGLK
jgi:hypothetical protein